MMLTLTNSEKNLIIELYEINREPIVRATIKIMTTPHAEEKIYKGKPWQGEEKEQDEDTLQTLFASSQVVQI